MTDGPSVWVTRAQPGAGETAARLRTLGRRPWVAPLLAVESLAGVEISLQGVGALAFTSANAVRAFAALQPRRDLAVFTVGDATAAAAHQAGFVAVRSADGDVAALARVVAEAAPAGAVLHPGAETLAGDLAGALREAGLPARTLALYRTVVVGDPGAGGAPPATLDTVLLHSPRAAGALAGYLAARPPAFDPQRLQALGLSAACVAPLRGSGLKSLRAAETPNEDALLALLA
jgi:uroporphyrinogen-III synthase